MTTFECTLFSNSKIFHKILKPMKKLKKISNFFSGILRVFENLLQVYRNIHDNLSDNFENFRDMDM